MAEVGELTWVAEIQGLANAKRDAESMSDEVGGLAEDARAADEAVGGVGDTAASTGEGLASLGGASSLLRGSLGLLSGTVLQLILNLTSMSALLGGTKALFLGIVGAINVLTGGLGALAAAKAALLVVGKALMAGLTAIAAALGLPVIATAALIAGIIAVVAIVWVFRDEIWAATKAVLGFFKGLLVDAVGFITSLASDIWAIATSLASDLITWAADLVAGVLGFYKDLYTGAYGYVSDLATDALAAVTGFASDVRSKISELVSDIIGFGKDLATGFTDAITDGVAGVWNTVIPSEVGFPEVTLPSKTIDAGPLGSTTVGGQTVFSGFSFDLPQLETGGYVESGGAVEVHDDEMVLPADVTRDVMDSFGGGARKATEQAVVRIEQLIIEIGDQTLDIRELNRFELEQLAELIGEQMGNELQRLV